MELCLCYLVAMRGYTVIVMASVAPFVVNFVLCLQRSGKRDGSSLSTSQTTETSSGQLASSMVTLRKTKVPTTQLNILET